MALISSIDTVLMPFLEGLMMREYNSLPRCCCCGVVLPATCLAMWLDKGAGMKAQAVVKAVRQRVAALTNGAMVKTKEEESPGKKPERTNHHQRAKERGKEI